mmetsp:Transcript_7862/g.16323  ORF Transcript_7862/g.16323 Transcript_7862/m.16323 type:complete len:268 (+) Transcript_7862:1520-2323(+)
MLSEAHNKVGRHNGNPIAPGNQLFGHRHALGGHQVGGFILAWKALLAKTPAEPQRVLNHRGNTAGKDHRHGNPRNLNSGKLCTPKLHQHRSIVFQFQYLRFVRIEFGQSNGSLAPKMIPNGIRQRRQFLGRRAFVVVDVDADNDLSQLCGQRRGSSVVVGLASRLANIGSFIIRGGIRIVGSFVPFVVAVARGSFVVPRGNVAPRLAPVFEDQAHSVGAVFTRRFFGFVAGFHKTSFITAAAAAVAFVIGFVFSSPWLLNFWGHKSQ